MENKDYIEEKVTESSIEPVSIYQLESLIVKSKEGICKI